MAHLQTETSTADRQICSQGLVLAQEATSEKDMLVFIYLNYRIIS